MPTISVTPGSGVGGGQLPYTRRGFGVQPRQDQGDVRPGSGSAVVATQPGNVTIVSVDVIDIAC